MAVAPTITSTRAMNGAKMKIRIGRPSCNAPELPVALPRPDSQIHSRSTNVRCLTCPGISAQNHPNRFASGSAPNSATGARLQVTSNVKKSADEIFRYETAEENCVEQM